MSKVLFFDMYQTLVDTQVGDKKEIVENAYKQVFSDFLIKQGIDSDLANNFQSNYKKVQDEFYEQHDKEKEHHDFKVLIAKTLADFYTINVDDAILINLILQYRKLTRGETKLYPGVKNTLEFLSKEYSIYLASYTQACYSLPEIEELGIKDYFKGFIFSSDIGYKKMDDAFYRKCIEVSNVTPENCVMIGDNKLEDMFMANKNGMSTIWIKNPITVDNFPNVSITPTKELDLKDFNNLSVLVFEL